jgi:enoyl-[acyl-carrier-protein] reductase (NADH)
MYAARRWGPPSYGLVAQARWQPDHRQAVVCAVDRGSHGIWVNAVASGIACTAMTGASLSNAAVRQGQGARIPAGRIADADDLAGVAVFHLSAAARYITDAWRLDCYMR